MFKKLILICLMVSISGSTASAFLGIGSGYDKRGEHCDGICNIIEYNCDLKQQALITPSDMLKRDAKKLPRVLTQNYGPAEMRAWCKKNCFHKSPWKKFKKNPDDYFASLCTPSASTASLANEKYTFPILPPSRYFIFRNHSPESLTLLSLKMLDEEFLKQTGGDLRRAVGSVEFVGLLYQSLVNNQPVHTMTAPQMDALAEQTMVEELKNTKAPNTLITTYQQNKTIPIPQLVKVLDSLKAKIFKTVNVKESDIVAPKF